MEERVADLDRKVERLAREKQQTLSAKPWWELWAGAYGLDALTNAEAWRVYQGFAHNRQIAVAIEPAGLEREWRRLAVRDSPSAKLWMDAYLAAFAIASRYQLVSIDSAFKQHDGLDLLLIEKRLGN